MLEQIEYGILGEAQVYVMIMGGIGIFILAMRVLAYFYIQCVARASENMAKTANRYLKSVRNAYDRELLRHDQVDNVEIFVEKELARLRIFGMPVAFADRLNVQGMLFVICTCAFGMVEAFYGEWDVQGIGGLVCVTVGIFVVLATAENMLCLTEVQDLIEVRMIDYFDNSVKAEVLMGERNLRRRERSLLLATAKALPIAEPAVTQEEVAGEPCVEDTDKQPMLAAEQEEAFIEMLNEFFV